MNKSKKTKVLLDLSKNESIFQDDKAVVWGGISPFKLIELGTNLVHSFENTLNLDPEKIYHLQYLKSSELFNGAHIANYHWFNEHMNGYNNEDFYLPDWNF